MRRASISTCLLQRNMNARSTAIAMPCISRQAAVERGSGVRSAPSALRISWRGACRSCNLVVLHDEYDAFLQRKGRIMTSMKNCKLCCTDGQCGASRQTYGCTRKEGHGGTHAACGYGAGAHPILRWGNAKRKSSESRKETK